MGKDRLAEGVSGGLFEGAAREMAEKVWSDDPKAPRFKTVYDRKSGNIIRLSQRSYDALDGNDDGTVNQEELDGARASFEMQRKKLEAKMAGTLRDDTNFSALAGLDGDSSGISGLDLAIANSRRADFKEERRLLGKISTPRSGIEKLFTQTNDGQKEGGLSYEEIDHALKNDRLNADQAKMLSYLLYHFNEIKSASQTDSDRETISLADLNSYANQRKKQIPNLDTMDAAVSTYVARRVPIRTNNKEWPGQVVIERHHQEPKKEQPDDKKWPGWD